MPHDAKSFACVSRKLKRQHHAHLVLVLNTCLTRLRHMPRPSPERASVIARVRSLQAALGLEAA